MLRPKYLGLVMALILIVSKLGGGNGHAQNSAEILNLGEQTLGSLSLNQPAQNYRLEGLSAEALRLTARSLSADFAPLLRLYTSDGRLIHHAPNPLARNEISLDFTPQANSSYTLEVLGVDGGRGDFMLSLRPSEGLTSLAIELNLGQSLRGEVSPTNPILRYEFNADSNSALLVQMSSNQRANSPAFVLSDADNNPLGLARSALGGAAFFIPPALDVRYSLSVWHSGAALSESFNLSLRALDSDNTSAPALSPTDTDNANSPSLNPDTTPAAQESGQTLIIPFDGPCAVTPITGQGVNVRSGPGLNYEISGGLNANEIVPVVGRNENLTWWWVEYRSGVYGWVAANVLQRGGNCSNVGLVSYPAPPFSTATPSANLPSSSPTPVETPSLPSETATP